MMRHKGLYVVRKERRPAALALVLESECEVPPGSAIIFDEASTDRVRDAQGYEYLTTPSAMARRVSGP